MTTVIEGEVVDVPRRRERNAARTPDVLPPDVDTKVVAIRRLDSPEMQARAITVMLNHARTGLLAAIAAHDLPQIVEWKQKAAAIQEIAKQVRLGKDMQLDAAEFVRRAERGLGVAIRDGQARGDIRGKSRPGNQHAPATEQQVQDFLSKPAPTDFASAGELHNGRHSGIYDLTDNVSDEAFEEALAEAREEENLSRANVARKAKARSDGASARDIDDPRHDKNVVPEPPPQTKKRLTKHDSTEMLANINGMLNGIVESLPFIDPTEIDYSNPDNRRVIHNIRESMARVRKLLKDIENG